jgi:hypothetical protein
MGAGMRRGSFRGRRAVAAGIDVVAQLHLHPSGKVDAKKENRHHFAKRRRPSR